MDSGCGMNLIGQPGVPVPTGTITSLWYLVVFDVGKYFGDIKRKIFSPHGWAIETVCMVVEMLDSVLNQ